MHAKDSNNRYQKFCFNKKTKQISSWVTGFILDTKTLKAHSDIILKNPTDTGNRNTWKFNADGTIECLQRFGMVLDIEFSKKTDGADVILYSVHRGNNQVWKLLA
jgi:hypothetical protein